MSFEIMTVRIKLPPKDMKVLSFIQQWSALVLGGNYEPETPVPITTHLQAANEAQDMYPYADEAMVTRLGENHYCVELLKQGKHIQTVTFLPDDA